MAHFEEVEVVAIMPHCAPANANAIDADGNVYSHFNGDWMIVGNGYKLWGFMVTKCKRPTYCGKFIIKAWVQ